VQGEQIHGFADAWMISSFQALEQEDVASGCDKLDLRIRTRIAFAKR